MSASLPYVTAAVICEKILVEKDGTISLVRIADKIQYKVQGLPPEAKPMVFIQGLITIKSGEVTGEHLVEIASNKPSGERSQPFSARLPFLGKDHGQNIILNIGLGIDEDGLYWFDVLFDGELLTRVPLIVTPLEEQMLPETKP